MFELITNVLLLVFMIYSFFTHVLEANIPKAYAKNPSNLMPDVWPKVIIGLICLCLVVNIVKIIRKNKDNADFSLKKFFKGVPAFLKSKTFFGIVIIVVASLILEPLGFVVTSTLILISYGYLLGERKIGRLVIIAVLLSLVLHIIFSGLLDVTLPRGTVGFLRNFALFLENLI